MSRKNTVSATRDPEADLSSDYLTSTSRCSSEADDGSDEDFIVYVLESLSADGETSSNSEEYMLGSKREENLDRRRKNARIKANQTISTVQRKNNKKMKNNKKLVLDDAGRKEDVKHRVP